MCACTCTCTAHDTATARPPPCRQHQEVAAIYNGCKRSLDASAKARVKLALKSFVDANDNPATSPNFGSAADDPVDVFIDMLQQQSMHGDANWVLWLLKSLKILSRKQPNRLLLGGAGGLHAVLVVLALPLPTKVAAEGANVLLNACYEVQNVLALLETPGVQQLILFLTEEDDEELQANAAGAIQSICFQEAGRRHVCDKEGIPGLLELLSSSNAKVVARAVGAIHNLSSEAAAIRVVRKGDGIPLLVALLRSEQLAVSGSAAGALQNVSREVASRLIIRCVHR